MSKYIKSFKVSEIYNKRGRLFQLDEETEVAVFKVLDEIYVVDNVCPHNHSPLMYQGYIEDNEYVVCPIHAFRFNLKTGEQPHKKGCKLRTFQYKIEDGYLHIKKPSFKIFDFEF